MTEHQLKFNILLFILAPVCISQTDHTEIALEFEHLSVEQGLSQSTVHSIIQDDKGFIWIGTQNGLNRFDGFDFTVYTTDKDDSASLSNDHIRTLIQDKNGFIWAGTNDGLNILTLIRDDISGIAKEGFYHFKHDPHNNSSLSNNEIRTIYQDRTGILWIGTANGLNKVSGYPVTGKSKSVNPFAEVKFIRYLNSPSSADGSLNSFGSNFISSIAEDSLGNLWIGTMGSGLHFFDRKTEKFTSFKNNPADPGSLSSNFIIRLYVDKSGELWIGTYSGGLCRYNYDSKNFSCFRQNHNIKNSISDNRIYSIQEDNEGNLWLGTFGNGIDKFIRRTGKFINFRKIENNPYSLSNDFIRTLLIDKSNNLWVGTNRGISKTDLKPQKFLLFKINPWSSSTLSDNYILSFFEDSGSLWIGTNKGLDKYDENTGKYTNFKIPHNTPRSGEGFVYAIYRDESGVLWLGAFGGGIYKFNPGNPGRIIKQYLHDPEKSNSITDNRVTTIYPDLNGDLLIGTVGGVCRFSSKNELFKNFIISPRDSSMLARKWINSIYIDCEHFYWVGTTEGLFRIDPESGNTEIFVYQPDNQNSLSNNSVSSFYEDKDKNIWIGTDEGLNMFDRKENKFIHFFKKDGLPSNSICGILGDDNGNLWISTYNGITKFSVKSIEGSSVPFFRNYGVEDGLQGMEFNPGAYFRNKRGDIFFGGLNGFNKFNPAHLKENPLPPSVVITAFRKFDKVEKTYLELSVSEIIELNYSDRFFSFEFASLDFTNPGKNQLAYMLEGFDNDWNYTGIRRFANYTNVDPGEYIFRVKGSNNDGVWNEQGASVKVIIVPPFYSTWWAYTVYIFAFLTALFSLRQYEINKRRRKEEAVLKEEREKAKLREAQLRAEKAELQAEAIESQKEIEKQDIRYRIASDLHDEIGSNLSSISLISSILTKNLSGKSAHPESFDGEILNHLRDINAAAKSSSEAIRDIVWFINPVSDQISNLVSRMKETSALMLSSIRYDVNAVISLPDEKISPDIKRNIYLMYKEVLNNIIKHSGANKVGINIEQRDGYLNLLVEDNGTGFDESGVSTGIGLKNLRTRAEQVKGELVINSLPGKGTFISLRVPL